MAKAKEKKVPEAPKAPERRPIQINVKYLRALRHIAADGDIRYYLNAVHFKTDKSGKCYTATDGHRIAFIREAWGNGEVPQDLELIIPREVCASAKLAKLLNHGVLKPVDAWTWTLDTANGIAQTFKAIDAKYPECVKVIPDKTSGEAGAYNWQYMVAFNACARDAFGTETGVELWQNGVTDAALVTAQPHNFVGVVMPLRMNNPKLQAPLPQWAVDVQKANVKRKADEKIEAEKRLKAEAKQLQAA